MSFLSSLPNHFLVSNKKMFLFEKVNLRCLRKEKICYGKTLAALVLDYVNYKILSATQAHNKGFCECKGGKPRNVLIFKKFCFYLKAHSNECFQKQVYSVFRMSY